MPATIFLVLSSICAALVFCTGCRFEAAAPDLEPQPAPSDSAAVYPENFPVPQYPGSRLATAMNTNDRLRGEAARAVVLSSGDDIYKMGSFYQRQLGKDGWQISRMTTTEDLLTINARRGKLKCAITISANSSFSIPGHLASTVQIVVSPSRGH